MNSKKTENVQRLIIPKGSISPNEVVVIEIPKRHRKTPVIVARRNTAGPLAHSRADNHFISGSKDTADAVIRSYHYIDHSCQHSTQQASFLSHYNQNSIIQDKRHGYPSETRHKHQSQNKSRNSENAGFSRNLEDLQNARKQFLVNAQKVSETISRMTFELQSSEDSL